MTKFMEHLKCDCEIIFDQSKGQMFIASLSQDHFLFVCTISRGSKAVYPTDYEASNAYLKTK